MADRFLREVSDMHQLRKDIRSLPPAKAEEFMKRLADDVADDWVFRARDAQLPPADLIDHGELALRPAQRLRLFTGEEHAHRAVRPFQPSLRRYPARRGSRPHVARMPLLPSRLTSWKSAVVGAIRWMRLIPARTAT